MIKHPYPYNTKYDNTAEEHMEHIGAISLDDFMKNVSDKYGASNDSTDCEQ